MNFTKFNVWEPETCSAPPRFADQLRQITADSSYHKVKEACRAAARRGCNCLQLEGKHPLYQVVANSSDVQRMLLKDGVDYNFCSEGVTLSWY